MTKKEKAKQLLEKVKSLETKKSLALRDEVTNLTNKLKDNFAVKTLKSVERIGQQVDQFQTDFDLTPLIEAIKQLEEEITTSEETLRQEFAAQLQATPDETDLKAQFETKLQALGVDEIKADLENFRSQLQDYITADIEEDKIEQEKFNEIVKKFRSEINQRFANLGGGQAAPQLLVGGSESKKYKDVNLKAGANITLTITDNNTTKRNEITIASTGGGGGGTVRSINSISVSQTAGATSGTDYVYLCSGTMTLTMPDATASNTNLYTIKNVGTGTITIDTTSAQTIDGNLTITMPVQFTSIDLISDTANWGIT